ncbi:MAG: extracellular solute-binding protein family 5 [Chloroflexi bacterium]|nr:extracellular solute-binding protein family 5 [Chloroflexota bacterium]
MRLRKTAKQVVASVLWASLVTSLCAVPADAFTAQRDTSTLTIGVLQLPTSLDPLINTQQTTRDITDAVFESLLSPDTHDALQPQLATRYTVSPNGLTYQFSLDPRARWQDGLPVTSADVLFTAKLMRDRHFPASNRYGFGNIATLSADGPLTVTATLRGPYAPFLRAFATTPIVPSHVLGPIPVAALAQYETFNRRPIGSGPYVVSDFMAGDHLTLTANPSYYRSTPRLQKLIFKLEPTQAAALAALKSGAVQMLGPSVGITPQQVLTSLQIGRFSAFASPGSGWTHIDLIESGFLRDHIVRQALTYATPRQRIVSTLFNGLATPADADQPPTSQYYEPAVAGSFPYDPRRIPGLLLSRGFKREHGTWRKFGRTLSITLWTDVACADCRAVAGLVAASWSAAGIPTVVRTLNQHKLFGLHGPLFNSNRLFDSNLNAVLYTWATSAEPDDSYYWTAPMIVRPGHLGGGNFDGYSNPKVDQLTNLAINTPDEAKRVSLYRQVQRLLVHDQPDVFLYWTSHLTLAVSNLHGYRANPFLPGVTWNVAQWSLS